MPSRTRLCRQALGFLCGFVVLAGCGTRLISVPGVARTGVVIARVSRVPVVTPDALQVPFAPPQSAPVLWPDPAPTSLTPELITEAEPATRNVAPGQTVVLTARLTGLADGTEGFAWKANGGTIARVVANKVVWTAPAKPGDVAIEVVATNKVIEVPGAYRFTVK